VLEQAVSTLSVDAQFSYTYGTHYLNLGYLPGGPVGVLRFAAAPRALLPSDFGSRLSDAALWEAPALGGLDRLDEFGLIVVIADAPDAPRAWIEQASAFAGDVPMVAVVSAGLEPLVRPYREGPQPQLAGMVAGLADAAQYEQQASLPGAATVRRGALGGGLLTAALILAIGNLLYALARRAKRTR
jgi:hypothetical protein